MDYTDVLRRLAINDNHLADECLTGAAATSRALDRKALALVRLAALIAVGGTVPSYASEADAAISAGATADEIVDVLLGVVPVVGFPSVVTAAPSLGLALGYDVNVALEES